EWQARPGLLEVRKAFFGMNWVSRFTEATLGVRLRNIPESGYHWFLTVEMPGRKQELTNDSAKDTKTWRVGQFARLIEILAGVTHFPVQDENGEVRPWV